VGANSSVTAPMSRRCNRLERDRCGAQRPSLTACIGPHREVRVRVARPGWITGRAGTPARPPQTPDRSTKPKINYARPTALLQDRGLGSRIRSRKPERADRAAGSPRSLDYVALLLFRRYAFQPSDGRAAGQWSMRT